MDEAIAAALRPEIRV